MVPGNTICSALIIYMFHFHLSTDPAKPCKFAWFICLLLPWRPFMAKCSLKCSSQSGQTSEVNVRQMFLRLTKALASLFWFPIGGLVLSLRVSSQREKTKKKLKNYPISHDKFCSNIINYFRPSWENVITYVVFLTARHWQTCNRDGAMLKNAIKE